MDLGGERVLAQLADRIGEQLSASQDPPALGPIDVATCPGSAGVVLLGMIYAAGAAGLGLVRQPACRQGFLIGTAKPRYRRRYFCAPVVRQSDTEPTGNSRV
jgi:hypothetical protein